MNFLFIIDNLGSGGAERQCVTLAILLKQRNHNVVILGYAKGDHFLKEVNNQGINYYLIEENNPIKRILKFRKKIRKLKPNVIIAFLRTPSLLAELSSFPFKICKLIVSERNNKFNKFSIRSILQLQFHRLADFVTTNSESTSITIAKEAPFLKGKIKTIYNGVDLKRFKPCESYSPNERKILIAVSSHQNHKNARNLILALKQLKEFSKSSFPVIYWYGSDTFEYTGMPSDTFLSTITLIFECNLQNDFILEAPVDDIENIYIKADALILCSFWEGLPNAVCEGMACGLPILMSNISDYITLTEGNGTFFDPHSVDAIANAINWFCKLDLNEILKMRLISREKAEILFPPEKMADSYINLTKLC